MNATCPTCTGDLRIRTSKRLHTNRLAYMQCKDCGDEFIATIQPAQVLNIAKCCSDNKSKRRRKRAGVKLASPTEN